MACRTFKHVRTHWLTNALPRSLPRPCAHSPTQQLTQSLTRSRVYHVTESPGSRLDGSRGPWPRIRLCRFARRHASHRGPRWRESSRSQPRAGRSRTRRVRWSIVRWGDRLVWGELLFLFAVRSGHTKNSDGRLFNLWA
jgi:hypothetical protein